MYSNSAALASRRVENRVRCTSSVLRDPKKLSMGALSRQFPLRLMEAEQFDTAEVRKRRVHRHWYSNWRWHLDEVFVRINGETCYLWRAVDPEGEVLEVLATKRRDRKAALRFLKRAMKRSGRPASIVTDGLRSYPAAMTVIGNAAARTCGRWLNNRAENSHQPFRRREGAMANFRDVKTLQKFASVHASIHNHFNHERHLDRRDIFKQARAAALAEWRQLAA